MKNTLLIAMNTKVKIIKYLNTPKMEIFTNYTATKNYIRYKKMDKQKKNYLK